MVDLDELVQGILERSAGRARFVVALAGPPGSGKSTLAEHLIARLPPGETALLPMDGFHYDDRVLQARGLASRKGAPETFDYAGLEVTLRRIRAGEPQVAVPVFDRSMELARAGAAIVETQHRIVVVEGNYLLLDESPWRALQELFDLSVYLDVPRAELDRRLVDRWRMHGRPDDAARAWIDSNDMPNIIRVQTARLPADIILTAEP